MELQVVRQAVAELESRGIPLSDITSVMVREVTGFGSFSTITQHLRALRGEASAGDEATDGSSENATTALATIADEDEAIDAVQAAEGALQRAKERLAQAEERVPELERQLADIREDLHRTTLRHMILAFEVGRGMLSDTDPELKASKADMWQAHRRHRQAKEQLERAPRVIESARGAVRLAQQQVWLARERPELVQRLADVEAQRPDDRGENAYRTWVIWKQSVESVKAEVSAAIAQAGL